MQQLMADVPKECLIPFEPPFTYTGVDFFGPFHVKHSVVWMVPQIDLIVPTKAEVKVLASLKRLGTIMLLQITPPVTQQMWPLTNSQAHALPLASVSCATRTMIWTTVKTT